MAKGGVKRAGTEGRIEKTNAFTIGQKSASMDEHVDGQFRRSRELPQTVPLTRGFETVQTLL